MLIFGLVCSAIAGGTTGYCLINQNNSAKDREIEANLIENAILSDDSATIVKRLQIYSKLGLFSEETTHKITTSLQDVKVLVGTGSKSSIKLVATDTFPIQRPFSDKTSGVSVIVNDIYPINKGLSARIKIRRPLLKDDEYKDMDISLPNKLFYYGTPYIIGIENYKESTDSCIINIFSE